MTNSLQNRSEMLKIMKCEKLISLYFALVIVLFACGMGNAGAGSIQKCKLADGTVTYTDGACPKATVNHTYMGEASTNAKPSGRKSPSLEEQVQMLKRMNSDTKSKLPERMESWRVSRNTKIAGQTYSECLASVKLKKRGKLGSRGAQLTKSQRARVARVDLKNKQALAKCDKFMTPKELQERANKKNRSGVVVMPNGKVLVRVAGGAVDPQNGTFYSTSGHGFVNSRTGAFTPDSE